MATSKSSEKTVVHKLRGKKKEAGVHKVQKRNTISSVNETIIELTNKITKINKELAKARKETKQLRAEIEVINSVQAGLASKMDLHAIYELIGEKVREVFKVQVVDIVTYNAESNLISMPYSYEKGDRSVFSPREPYGFRQQVIRTGVPLLISHNFVKLAAQYNNPLLTGTWPKSALFVPMMTEGRVIGIISLQDIDRENAFSASDVQLLQTLANAMSVAIENARLFDETQHRARELATVNTVSAALVSELDLNMLIDLVGEQLRSVFKADIAYVALLDQEKGIINFPYQYGEQHLEPIQLGQGLTSRIIQTGAPLLINEAMNQQRQQLGVALIGKQALSYLGVPIFVSGEAIGVISVQSTRQEGRFTENDQRLLNTIASNVGIAFQNARLFKAEQQAREQAETLRSVAQALNRSLSLKDVFDLVLTEIQKVIPYDSAGIYQVLENRRVFAAGRGFTNIDELIGISFEFNQHEDEIGYLISRSLKPIILADASKSYPQYFSTGSHAATTIRSYLAVPIIDNQNLIGMITLDMEEPGFYNEHYAQLAMAFAAQAATAINNASLFNQTQRLLKETEQRAAELDILNSVSEAMVKTLDVNTMTKLVGEKVLEIFDTDSVEIMLLDPQTNLIHVSFEYDKNEGGYIDYVEPFPLGTGLASKVIRTGEPLMLNTLQEEIDNGAYFPPEIIERGEGILSQSWLGVPIKDKDQVLGILALANQRPYAFNDNQLHLLETLSSNVGVAIINARLYQGEQQRVSELAIINSVQAGLASKLDMQEIYDLVGEKLRDIFHNTDLSIIIYEPAMNLIHMPYAFEYGKRWAHDPIPLPEYGFIAHVFRTGKTLVLNENVTKAFEEYGGHILTGPTKESGLQGPFTLRVGNLVVSDLYIEKSSVHVPLVSGGQTRGVIALENMEREHAFSESDVRLLETLASSMSIALENARLWEQEKLFLKALQRELEIGREIQAGFLPDTLPQAEGWEITALLMSAREVAGDFYDVFELSDGNIGLVIADVCDKGVGAALFMTLFRSLVRVIANQEYFEKVKDSRQTHSIQERLIHTMNLTNNYIAETHEKSGMFATLFFGILNPQDGTLTYINGGHEPPLILQAGKVRESLIKTGPAVGVMINSNFETGEIQLMSGDIFFAFTDGVPDCMDPHGEFFGHQRIYDAFQTNCESAHTLIEHLRSELDRHIRDADQFDDITLLAVQRK